MAVAGLTPADFMGSETELLPENVRAFEVFSALGTQWRAGMGGATGLDYNAIIPTLRLMNVPRADWPDVFDDLRVMESAAMTAMSNN